MKNWLDKYSDDVSKAENGIERTMSGLTDKGFNYNGAWGGTMQMGGNIYPVNYVPQAQMGVSLPGASGMMYAREGAPSNGKYAKKTLPSAQEGRTVTESTSIGKDRRLPSTKDIIKKIPGTNAYKDVYGNLLEKDNNGVYKPRQKEEEVRQHVPQSKLSKLKEIALNPMTAAGYKVRNENIPDNFSRSEDTRNNLDTAVDFINPAFYVESAINLGKNQEQVFSDLSEGNFGDAVLSQTMAGVEALNFIPLAKQAKPFVQKRLQQTGKYLTEETALARLAASKESGLLSNAYKYNPFAKKAESFNNPNSFYRQIDKKTFIEGVESGLIKGKQDIGFRGPESGSFNLNKSFGDEAYYKKGSLYSPQRADYIYEVNKGEEFFIPKVNNRTRGYTTENTPIRVSKEPIPITEANVYQKDWLKGYKPIEVPKQKEGGVIKNDLGQWAHPGEITEINSPYITMKGVPYPVLGISDVGDTQMMYPEEEYEFEGNKVTEYPLAKNGKELVKLNQLVNFTNYNTKQSGGWLDKYN
jgi:hypothetical protein